MWGSVKARASVMEKSACNEGCFQYDVNSLRMPQPRQETVHALPSMLGVALLLAGF